MADYEFRYAPLTGRITGKQMLEQTEQAINGLASLVDEAAGQVNIISTLANEANENAANAIAVAEEALATTGRTYITVSIPADANDYYDSELIYIADSTSTNIPVADTGMLEAKTNDNKTVCEQCFVADSSGEAYYRNGIITAETVGDVTTYTVAWGGWSSEPASQAYVQSELTNYAPLADLANYLPLSGGTMTGAITLNSTSKCYITGYGNGVYCSADESNASNRSLFALYTNADGNGFKLRAGNGSTTKDLNGNPDGTLTWNNYNILTAANYNSYALPLNGGTMTGSIVLGVTSIATRSVNNSFIQINGGTTQNNGAYARFNGKDNTGNFQFNANDGNDSVALVGKPNGTLTWNSKSIPQRAYGVQLTTNAGENTYTFTLAKNSAVIFAKRNSNCSCHMVDYWSADSVKIFSTATDPITVTKSADSGTVTITNAYTLSVAIKIINADEL